MRVNEIFLSINGEGRNSGLQTVFLRLTGCNVRCRYCDTLYAMKAGMDMSVDEVVDKLWDAAGGINPHRVTITGGEPLLQEDEVYKLVDSLPDTEFEIETNGTVRILHHVRVSYTVDWKTPSSGVAPGAIEQDYRQLDERDTVKFVVGKGDLDYVEETVRRIRPECRAQIILSPVFGETDPKDLVRLIIENDWWDVRVQLQIQKYIWDANTRGV